MKIRVAHLLYYLAPAGKEIGIVKLLNGLDPNSFEGSLIILEKIYDDLGLDMHKTEVTVLNQPRGNDYLLPFKLAKIFKKGKYDIVHTHAWGTLVEGVLGAKLAGIPVIIHGEHGTFHRTGKRKIAQKLVFNWADRLLSVSDVLADDISKTIGIQRNKFHTIMNGVDTDRFKPDMKKRRHLRAQYALGDETILIGTVGRPTAVKNQQLMVKALPSLIKKFGDVRFMIIGMTPRNSLRGDLEFLAKELGVSDNLIFTGPQSDIPGYLNAFDIFVLPSLSEGCSNVIQEAMATALPIVASNVGGTPELLSHNQTGLLFESNNVQALEEAIVRLLNDEAFRKQLGRSARQKTEEIFSLETMISAYQDFYQSLIKK